MENRVIWKEGLHNVDLCLLEKEDLRTLYHYINTEEVYRFLRSVFPKSEVQEAEFINQALDGDKKIFGILSKKYSRLIGLMSLHKIDSINQTAETASVLFREDDRGKGYGTEAKMLLLHYCFEYLNLHCIESRLISSNPRSQAYSEKCGYVIDAILPSRISRYGKRWDMIIMSVTRERFIPIWEEYQSGL
jgi:RimJ/RimL family protein N-acetyltransferase